jgi:hypothetical protein
MNEIISCAFAASSRQERGTITAYHVVDFVAYVAILLYVYPGTGNITIVGEQWYNIGGHRLPTTCMRGKILAMITKVTDTQTQQLMLYN